MLVNLCAEMVRHGITDVDIANTINRERRAVKNRLDCKVQISSSDLKKIRDKHFPFYTLDYLLSEVPTVEVPSTSAPAPASEAKNE